MSFEAASTAIVAHFKTAWEAAEGDITVEYDGVDFTPPDPRPRPDVAEGAAGEPAYLRVTLLDGPASQVSMGETRRWRQTGVLVISIFSLYGVGDGRARELADTAAGIVRGTTVSGVTLRAPELQRIGRVGPWLQHNLKVPYYFDLIA